MDPRISWVLAFIHPILRRSTILSHCNIWTLDEACLSLRSITSAAKLQPAQLTEPGCVWSACSVHPSPGRCESQGIPFEEWKLKPRNKSTSWTSKILLKSQIRSCRALDRSWSITLKHFLPSSQPNFVNFLPTQHHRHTGWRWRRPMAFRHSLARCRFGSHWIRQPHLGCPGWRPRLPRPPQKRSDSFQNPRETTVFIPKHRYIPYNLV